LLITVVKQHSVDKRVDKRAGITSVVGSDAVEVVGYSLLLNENLLEFIVSCRRV
jgi:hypothetical protein